MHAYLLASNEFPFILANSYEQKKLWTLHLIIWYETNIVVTRVAYIVVALPYIL